MDDNKYFGLYRGIVADVNDPLNRGRVRLIIPQVLGEAITEWAWPMGGAISQNNWPYGTFYTAADQAIGVNTPTVVNNWLEADANKMSLSSNRINIEETGDYFMQFSCMFIKTNASAGLADLWVRVNGVDVPDSNTRITLQGSNAEITMTVGLILDLNAGDYVQFVSSASASNVFLSHSPAGVGPAVPGIISTFSLIGKWKPKAGTAVWVMFEGGEPNFPVWIGGL